MLNDLFSSKIGKLFVQLLLEKMLFLHEKLFTIFLHLSFEQKKCVPSKKVFTTIY